MKKLLYRPVVMHRVKRIERVIVVSLLLLSAGIGAGLGVLLAALQDTADIRKLEHFTPEVPSRIYDRNGRLISTLFTVHRAPVTFSRIPRHLINAVLAIEDARFYEHHGVDFHRVLGALWANIKAGHIVQGASTITMQLARTLFTGREKTYARKIKETWLALKIEKRYAKNRILTLYFNQIYFGHGAYGIQSASRFYFNKPVEELTLAECALLAGLPKAPNVLSPLRNPGLARKRQELVLERMVSLGMVSSEEAYDSFQDFWVGYRMQLRSPSQSVYQLATNRAPHFTEHVRRKLEPVLGAKRLYTGGLKIYTSLDLKQQELARTCLSRGLRRQDRVHRELTEKINRALDSRYLDALDMLSLCFGINGLPIGRYKVRDRVYEHLNERFIAPLGMLTTLFGFKHVNRVVESAYLLEKKAGKLERAEGALIALEPGTGYITAMVGGSSFSTENQLNRAVQIRRPTGSGFKPYIYTAAIDTKMFTPAAVITDAPAVFFDGHQRWIPDNYSGTYRGPVRLREALRKSINVVTAKVVDRLGFDTVIAYASKIIGITGPREIEERFPPVHSLALGVVELSPCEQARGFATFANRGVSVDPIAVLYVLDRDGNLIRNFEAELRKEQVEQNRRVLSPQTSFIITDMLRDVLRPGGTGWRAAHHNGFDRPAAGKTGTTQNWKDAWFTGFTPDLVASVWVGYDRYSVSLGRGRAGGVVAGPIWARFMRGALEDREPSWYDRPPGVLTARICRGSGLLPTPDYARVMTEYFLPGTVPTRYCAVCGSPAHESFNPEVFRRVELNQQGASDTNGNPAVP
jgi:penicillin-binding protein 1A